MIFIPRKRNICVGREGIPFQWNTKVSFRAQRKRRPAEPPSPAEIASDHRASYLVELEQQNPTDEPVHEQKLVLNHSAETQHHRPSPMP
jgi:hypothetical protein